MAGEIDFLLETAAGYLTRRPSRADILSVFTGIRPLVKAGSVANTSSLSREHTITISKSGLLSVVGGKWTTYRKMAEDCIEQAIVLARLEERPCVTRELHIHGWHRDATEPGSLAGYGSDAQFIKSLEAERHDLAEPLHAALPVTGAQVVWAVRAEMARTLDDVLARRTRALFLNVRAAQAMAPAAARLMAQELGKDEAWEQQQLSAFEKIADGFSVAY